MSDVREKLLEMGATQGGRRLTILHEGKMKDCASFVDGEWVATPEFAKILGQKSPAERKEDQKATVAKKAAPKKKAAKKKS